MDLPDDFDAPLPVVDFAALLSATVEVSPTEEAESVCPYPSPAESLRESARPALPEAASVFYVEPPKVPPLAPSELQATLQPPVSGTAIPIVDAPALPTYGEPAVEPGFGAAIAEALERIAPGAGQALQAHQIPPPEFNDPKSSVTGFLLTGGRNTGKALALDTPIPTPHGWSTVGELDVGDWLFDEMGRRTLIKRVFDVTPYRTVRLHFSDGTHIDACDDHRWVSISSSDIKRLRRTGMPIPDDWASQYRISRTEELIDGREVIIPLAKPLELPERDLPLDPYLLGFWLGNGVRGTSRITCHLDDEEFLRHQISERTDFVSAPNYRGAIRCADFSIRGLIHVLRALGIERHKHIPSPYMRGSVAQRSDLLAGLLDSDGYMAPPPRGSIEFSSTDEELAVGVVELARSLGQRPTIHKAVSTLYGVEKGPRYRVTWRPSVNPFQSPRKAAAYTEPKTRHYRKLVKHEILPPVPMRCFTVDSRNHMFLVGEGMIPTHNSYAGTRWLHSVMTKHPGARARIIAPSFGDAVASCIEGPSGILEASNYQVTWKPTHPGGAVLLWPNGSVCYVIGTPTSREVDRLRAVGNITYDLFEEAAANPQIEEVERQARLSRRQVGAKWVATTTPRPIKTIREWVKDPTVAVSAATSHDNKYADPLWLAELESMYKGTRLYRQEVLGEVLTDIEGALWSLDNLDRSRIGRGSDTPLAVFQDLIDAGEIKITRGAVGVDPGNTTGTTGIVVVLMSSDLHLYVVEDLSMPALSSKLWAASAVAAAKRWDVPIVAENDSGGDAIKGVLKAADPDDVVQVVPARAQGRGSKGVRAEPIALLWERDEPKGHMVGVFPHLESELSEFVPEVSASPDRLDAMVWACTYLHGRASFNEVTMHEPSHMAGSTIRRPGVSSPWRTKTVRSNRSNRVNQE